MCGPAAGKKINYYSNPSNMGKESGKGKDKARQAKASADSLRDTREKRLEARTLSQSHSDGLAGAAAAATAAASMGVNKGSTVSSPPRTDRGRSADAESPLNNKGRRSNSGRRLSPGKSSVENSEAEGSDRSLPASGSEDELLATNANAVATGRLKAKAKIIKKLVEKVDSNAT
jgi:hypothetical protein